MHVHEVLVNRLGGLSLPRKSVVRLTDCPDMTLDIYHGRKITIQQQQLEVLCAQRELSGLPVYMGSYMLIEKYQTCMCICASSYGHTGMVCINVKQCVCIPVDT